MTYVYINTHNDKCYFGWVHQRLKKGRSRRSLPISIPRCAEEWSSLLRSKEECLALHSHGLIEPWLLHKGGNFWQMDGVSDFLGGRKGDISTWFGIRNICCDIHIMEKRRSVSRFLWGRVEDYCSWIHSLELLGRKVKLWVSRKHLSSFKNACFTLRYYSIPLIILWVLVLLWLLNDTVTCPWGDQGRVWVEWCTASEAETYFVPPLRCLNWSRWICNSSNQSSCLTGIFIQKKLPAFWNPVTILRRRAVGLFRDCGWKGDIDFFKVSWDHEVLVSPIALEPMHGWCHIGSCWQRSTRPGHDCSGGATHHGIPCLLISFISMTSWMVNHKIQAPTTIESLHIVICDTICWGPSWEGTWNDGSRMHGCMHHLHYRHPLCGGWCSSFYALENSSRQEFCRILKGLSEGRVAWHRH